MKNINDFIKANPSFTTKEFVSELRDEIPDIGRSTVFKILQEKCESGEITRTSKGRFIRSGKRNYSHELSDTAGTIAALIQKTYPLVSFQIWELVQFNEFVNHLFSRNTIFVEVENMLVETVFDELFRQFPHVLCNPGIDEYYKYAGEETVIVQRLISEAPSPAGTSCQASMEKLLVDLFSKGISGNIVPRSEYPQIFEEVFQKYNINQAKLFRYARRRNNKQIIRNFIRNETSVRLENLDDR